MNERHLYNVQNYLLCHKETSNRFNLFIDIGANKLWHSNYLKKHFKKVVAFEPTPNGEPEPSVLLHYTALSDKTSKKTFYKNQDTALNSFHHKWNDKIEIHTHTLDSYDYEPDLIKIDTECHELHILQGAINTIKKSKPNLAIDIHSTNKKKVKSFLKDLGYKQLINDEKNLKSNKNFFYYEKNNI
jgi:FkbM family methyltransferase|tara:strand:+ start:17 stop:574 length:558 start_codon:yes stop_codon:yes gene_type:complete